ncbi:Rpn family recombination-promoting nuclease/putative transposase [Desulfovibrio porci]|uniref:Rpn family recombination-promoting nuclease/putative transposase n=1 Tax=Desulfovibrio porci TaxID=2605782 RepID=UPI003A90A254
MKSERQPHDPSFKAFFSVPEMVASLLRDFVPEDFIVDLDFSTLERCSGDYVTDDLRERHGDVVWRVCWKDSWGYFLLVLESQSRKDPWMAVRILAYTALLWQDLIKTGAVSEKNSLPPVFLIVIYNGSKPWNAAQDVADLLAPQAGRLLTISPIIGRAHRPMER